MYLHIAMSKYDKVQSSPEGKEKLREAYKNLGLNQNELAEKANTSEDTVKRLLGTKDCPNGVQRWAVENIAKAVNLKPTDIVVPEQWYPQQLPEEFKTLIKEKTDSFCGRKFVFEAIEEFIKYNPNGYFTVVGDAGMGKSAIAAKYILDNPGTVCFFNIRSEGRNRPELFLKSVRQQLLIFYPLSGMADTDLSTLLTKARENIPKYEPLVIVVDALDEVNQEGTGNLLYLPTILPEGVYFVLTRRPYTQNEHRLNFSPSVPTEILDLREEQQASSKDVGEYINQSLQEGKYHQGLQQWITEREVSQKDFVSEIAVKSENNFMYLRCVLPAIAEGFYDEKPLDELPVGLQGYYENHWQIMGMTSKPLPRHKIKIVYVMCALRSAASPRVIAKYSQQDLLDVQYVLSGWAQFIQKQDSYQPPRYRFYHESFRDFLHRQDIVQAAGISLQKISAEVADIMMGEIFNNG